MTLLSSQLPEGQHHAIGMVDIGASMTTLSVFAGDESIYTREHLFGGMQLTDDIMSRYGLSFEEAGRAKKQGGLPDGCEPDDYDEAVLAPFLEAVESQISRSLQFFFSSSEYAELDCIVLCGGVAVMEGLAERISKRLSTPTIIANPFAGMSVAARVNAQALARDAPAMMVACGLAMRRLSDG
jgi:type IV pilus assembly protein PilM